ncbi:hypothetical protein EV714DRAFT_239507 [Schizophyllum commune]
MLPLIRRRLLGALKNPALIIQFIAFGLNVISIIGAYDSNPIFVTVCGSVSALVAFLLGVFSKHLARRHVPYPKYDVESPPVSDAEEETEDCPLPSAVSSTSVASQHTSHPDSATVRHMPRGSPPQSVRTEPTYTGGGWGSTGAWVTDNASEPSFPYYASVQPRLNPQPIMAPRQVTYAGSPPLQAPSLPSSSRGLKGLDKFSSFGRSSSRLTHLAKENGWSVNNIFTASGADHARTHVCRVHCKDDCSSSDASIVNGQEMGRGRAHTKKHAEDGAAREALRRFGLDLLNIAKTFDWNKGISSSSLLSPHRPNRPRWDAMLRFERYKGKGHAPYTGLSSSQPASRVFLRVLSNTGLMFHFLAFALSMAAVIGAFDSNPIFVTICGSLAPVVAILGLVAKRLILWRSTRRREDPEAGFNAVVADDPWDRLTCSEAVSPATSSISLCSSSPPRSPDATSAFINPWAERETLPQSSPPPSTLPSPSDEAIAMTEVTPLILPIRGIDKLSGYTRWRARLRFLVKENGWAMSEECTLDGPKHIRKSVWWLFTQMLGEKRDLRS